MSNATDTLEAAIINHFFRGSSQASPATIYLALFTTMPNEAGSGAVEVAGGSYARQAITLSAPGADGTVSNTAPLEYPNMPAATVLGGGIYTHVSAGSLFAAALFTLPRAIAAGKTFVVKAGDVVVVVA